MEDVTRRSAVTAATAGAAGIAAIIGSQASAEEGQMSGSERLMINGQKLGRRPLNIEALTRLVNHLTERRVVWWDWHLKGTPVFDVFDASFTVSAAAAPEVLSYILGHIEEYRPGVVIFPYGIPTVDNFNVNLEINGAAQGG